MVNSRTFRSALPRGLCQILAAMALALVALWPSAASASTSDRNATVYTAKCYSYTAAPGPLAAFANDASQWTCDGTGLENGVEAVWLRFDAASWAQSEPPRYFFSRIARHEAITFVTIGEDGSLATLRHTESDGVPYSRGPVFQLDLPQISDETRYLLARIDGPHSVPIQTEAALSAYPEGGTWTQLQVMLLAFVMGMLVLPLLLDVSFYWVLRERFVLLHSVMVVSMMVYVLFASGLVSVFATFPVAAIAIAGPLSWAFGIGVSAIFLVSFLEDGAQSTLMRRATLLIGIWTLLVPGFFALQLPATQSFDDAGYFYSFLPVIFVISVALIEALRRGSRSARFVAVAWFPIIFASVERTARGLGLYTAPSTMDQMLYIGTGLEVIVIAVAIGDRFLTLRRERDEAVTEAKMLEKLTERDPLTGLRNRRTLDAGFVQLHEQGFDTFALIDLDHFKSVNDTQGHQVGDEVLKVAAKAIASDPDSIAIRMGGEEFLILLKGANVFERAEKLRQSIPWRVAQQVPELDHLVTASMGVIQIPREAMPTARFADIYSRADMLLYAAKEQGRNKQVNEQLKPFDVQHERRAGRDRRRADRAA